MKAVRERLEAVQEIGPVKTFDEALKRHEQVLLLIDEALALLPPEGETRNTPCVTMGGCSLGNPYSCGMACAEPAPSSEKVHAERDHVRYVSKEPAVMSLPRIPSSEKALRDAFESGYSQGHNDTVEGTVRDMRDAANDYLASSPAPEAPKDGAMSAFTEDDLLDPRHE